MGGTTLNTHRLGFIALALTTACAGRPPGSVGAESRNPDVLARAELLQSAQRSKDLFEAIRSLRPNFINPRTTRTQGAQARSLPRPVVYVDGALSGELDVLKGIMVENVEEVRFKGPTEATMEFGPNAPGGAILVTLRKAPRQ